MTDRAQALRAFAELFDQMGIPYVVMGGLAIARVPYGTYLRWVWPLVAMLGGLSIVVLAVGALLA